MCFTVPWPRNLTWSTCSSKKYIFCASQHAPNTLLSRGGASTPNLSVRSALVMISCVRRWQNPNPVSNGSLNPPISFFIVKSAQGSVHAESIEFCGGISIVPVLRSHAIISGIIWHKNNSLVSEPSIVVNLAFLHWDSNLIG